jgi:DNA-binding GntR family transcriptional regulator
MPVRVRKRRTQIARFPTGTTSSLTDVYNHIKARILRLEYPPGMNLAEVNFVAELKVSRTPVREALIKLASEGLVELHQNRGAWVSEITLSDIRQFFEALDVAQRMVTRLAALRFNPAALPELRSHALGFDQNMERRNISGMHEANFHFHRVIAQNCGNSLVAEHYIRLLNIGTRISHLALAYEYSGSPDGSGSLGLDSIGDEHRGMVESLMTGQADKAEEIAREHTIHFRQRVMNYLMASAAVDIKVSE